MCGQDADSLKKVKIEGAVLKVCDSCAEMGEEVKTSSKRQKKKKSGSRSSGSKKGSSEVLVNDYGDRVKEAREDETLSIQELSDELNEKESLLKKVEQQELKPDKPLANKLSKRFNITLYTNPEVTDYSQEKGDTRKATMEDVADIKD